MYSLSSPLSVSLSSPSSSSSHPNQHHHHQSQCSSASHLVALNDMVGSLGSSSMHISADTAVPPMHNGTHHNTCSHSVKYNFEKVYPTRWPLQWILLYNLQSQVQWIIPPNNVKWVAQFPTTDIHAATLPIFCLVCTHQRLHDLLYGAYWGTVTVTLFLVSCRTRTEKYM